MKVHVGGMRHSRERPVRPDRLLEAVNMRTVANSQAQTDHGVSSRSALSAPTRRLQVLLLAIANRLSAGRSRGAATGGQAAGGAACVPEGGMMRSEALIELRFSSSSRSSLSFYWH